MSYAQDFAEWRRQYDEAPPPADGDDTHPIADLAWQGMVACANNAEYRDGDIEDAAREIASALPWTAFWLAAGAVLVAAILRGAS